MSQLGTDNSDIIYPTQPVVYGLEGDDKIYNFDLTGEVWFYGGGGADYIQNGVGSGISHLYGGVGNDVLNGGLNADYLSGDEGDDLIVGLEMSDLAFSSTGAVQAYDNETSGNDELNGGAGADAIYGFDGKDVLYGGEGNDGGSINVRDYEGDVQTTQAGLFGGTGNDYLDGGRGNDYLDGGDDHDTLIGGEGSDRLTGGYGNDVLTGGAGGDAFLFLNSLSATKNLDIIRDFSHDDDVMQLSASKFAGLDLGTLEDYRFKEIGFDSQTAGVDKSDRILYEKDDGDLFFDRDGSGTEYGRVKFATISDNTSLNWTDFFIV